MRLPPELRNQIYALTLTDPAEIYLFSKTKRYRRTVERAGDPKWPHLVPDLVPNLLLLDRAIHAEARPILYASNTFIVQDTTAMHAFLATIGPKNRANITDLILKGWGYTKAHKALNHPALTMLVDAVNLRRFKLDCEIFWRSEPKRIAKQVYRDGFHWLEAVGAAKGKFDAAVDIVDISDECLVTCYYLGGEYEQTRDELREQFKAELRRLLSWRALARVNAGRR